jgi:RNA polymerase sigma-70 factor (ECF subfamily)
VELVIRGVQPAEDVASTAAGAGSGDDSRTAAWLETLFHEQYPRIVGMLARLVGDRGHAEEIAADVFCKVANRPALATLDDLTAWVYRVATNAGLDAVRSNARRRRREQEAGVESLRTASTAGALDGLLQEERRERVQAVLATLKPREAQLLLLRANGLAYRELAQSLGIQPGSVGTLLARAEAEFERKFRARYGGEA